MAEYCTVVTGASGGIGGAVVERLAAAGRKIVAVGRDKNALEGRFGPAAGVFTLACDLSSPGAADLLAVEIKTRFDGVEGFVHAAGSDIPAPLGMISAAAMQEMFAVHAVFPLLFLGWMVKKGNHAPGASAVLISWLAAHEGAKGHAAYAAAKGAVEGMLKPAAAECAVKGIRLNAVVPGIVRTKMSKKWMDCLAPASLSELEKSYPFGFGTPEDIAAAAAFLLSPDARWISGQTLVCDGGRTV